MVENERKNGRIYPTMNSNIYSDKFQHETRVLYAEVSKEEFEAVKKAIIGVM
jgi:hypothetical protein